MTTTEVRRSSAYPLSVDELLPKARLFAEQLGELPSRNQLMRELKIGARKASALLAELAAGRDTHQAAATVTELRPARRAAVVAGELELAATTTTEPAGDSSEAPEAMGAAVVTARAPVSRRRMRSWPVLLLALPAFVAIWSGWVGLGGLTGFGVVHPLPGIWDDLSLNTAITLPIGMETYAAFALRAWLSGSAPARARRFAKWSAIASLALGAAGQVAYHLMSAAGVTNAPWLITTVVACLPVAVLGMGAALAHLLGEYDESGSGSGEEVSR